MSTAQKPSRAKRVGLVLLLLVPLLLVGYVALKGLLVLPSALSAMGRVGRLQALADQDPAALLLGGGLDVVSEEVQGLYADLSRIQRRAGGDLALVARLRGLPHVGPTLGAAPHLLEMGVQLAAAGGAALAAAQPLMATLLEPDGSEATSDGLTQQVLQSLTDQQAQWSRAQVAAEAAGRARARFSADGLPSRLASPMAMLDRYLPWLRSGTTALVLAPELMGASGPRHYLVLAQNNDELRATGGYVSGIGLVVLDQGKLVRVDFQDSYAVDDLTKDHPDPPPAMREQMGIDLWLTKDTNWFPHFSTSAQACMDIYYIDQGISTDGVIAADMVALERVVAALGPLELPEYGVQVDGSNVMALIQDYWAPDLPEGMTWEQWEAIPWQVRKATWFDTRKSFMPDLVAALQDRLFTDLASLDIQRLLWTAKSLLDEKHVLIHLPDPRAQEALRDLGWGGDMLHPDHDYLAVVDTNVGYTKVNPNIAHEIGYHVRIDSAGRAQGELALSYTNTSQREIAACVKDMRYEPTYELMTQRCYWNYVRVYTPQDTALLGDESGSGAPRPADVDILQEETEHTIWASSFVIAPGESHHMSFAYALPDSVVEKSRAWTYRLLAQKQAGTDAVPLSVTVQLPQGARLVAATPRPASVDQGRVTFITDLLVDRAFELVFAP